MEKTQTTGYLSGTFDLFHIGHLNIIRRAKEMCGRLIVGVHETAAFKSGTTFIPFEERLDIIRACRYVDEAVTASDEDSTDWERFHFDILFVGSDYQGSERFRRYEEFFADKGVEIVYLPYTTTTSSSQIRELIRKQLPARDMPGTLPPNPGLSGKTYKIAVAGCGYVGTSLAVLLAQNHDVTAVDISAEKAARLNRLESPFRDEYIESFFAEAKSGKRRLHLKAVTDGTGAYAEADFIIIAVPTNYSPEQDHFDCSSVETVLTEIRDCTETRTVKPTVVIKSTIPVGYTRRISEALGMDHILFCPEFLRESQALYDCLYPSRIIVGSSPENEPAARVFAAMLQQGALAGSVPVLFMNTTEAEAVKLFVNTYLAMRVSFFNELDTYAELEGLNTDSIIRGICLDPRVGDFYNNPSFGYGGYCLPKDTRQLLANFSGIPEKMISATVAANNTRKDYIAERILLRTGKSGGTVGIFRLAMKSGSDNFRESSVCGIMERLKENGVPMIVYEPTLPTGSVFMDCPVDNDLESFKNKSSCIIANRYDTALDDVKEKVYTRDLFRRD